MLSIALLASFIVLVIYLYIIQEEIRKTNKEVARVNREYKETIREAKQVISIAGKKLERTESILNMFIEELEHKPEYANNRAAGLDIRAAKEITLEPGKPEVIETDLRLEIPPGYFGLIAGRSGLSFKHSINIYNGVGIIDEDYRGNIGIKLINNSTEAYKVRKGERVAQMIVIPYIQPYIRYVEELSETDRGANGYGSTGKL